MPYYLLLKENYNFSTGKSTYKNMGVYSASSISVAKKKLQKWVDMGKKPKGQYMFINSTSAKSSKYYEKTKKITKRRKRR